MRNPGRKVFVLMTENHSFDHVFGYLPAVGRAAASTPSPAGRLRLRARVAEPTSGHASPSNRHPGHELIVTIRAGRRFGSASC